MNNPEKLATQVYGKREVYSDFRLRLRTSHFEIQTSDFGIVIYWFSLSLVPAFAHQTKDTSRFPKDPQSLLNYVGLVNLSKKYLHIITHCIKNILCILYIWMKVETSKYSYTMTASLMGRALILVKMSVEIFIYFFIDQIMCLTSQWPIMFSIKFRARVTQWAR
jgi:hypothetical protein